MSKRVTAFCTALLFAAFVSISFTAQPVQAFHFPWDQGHDTFTPDDPGEENEKECGCEATGGDPVNLQTGQFLYSDTYHDIQVADFGPELSLSFTYQTQDRYTGPFGRGWHTNHTEIFVYVEDGDEESVLGRIGSGHRRRFTRQSDGTFKRPNGMFATVGIQPDNSVILTDKFGTVKTFGVDGRLLSVADRNGNTLAIAYDVDGVISTVTGASGRTLTFARGANGRIASVTDSASRVYAFTYDANGNLETATDPEGGVTTYEYNADGNMTRIIDPRGNAHVTNTYDSFDRVTNQVYADGTSLSINYQGGNVTTVTNERGLTSTTGYNDAGNPTSVTDELGRTIVREFNDDFLPTRTVDARGIESLFEYDAMGNLIRFSEAVGTNIERTSIFAFDPVYSQLSQLSDGNGNVTSIALDGTGNAVSITNADGDGASSTYDVRGLVTSATDENGNTTTFSYGATGDVESITTAEGDIAQYNYDSVGNRTEIDEGVGTAEERKTTFSYDGLNRVVSITDGKGGTTSYLYDNNSNLTKKLDPANIAVDWVYDARNRVVSTSNLASGQNIFSYDATGNLTQFTASSGAVTSYAFDSADQLVTATDALGGSTTFTYDLNGNILTVSNARNATTTLTYDELNRRTSRIDPGGRATTYIYDANDNLIQVVDALGQSTTNIYDSLNRLVSVTTPDNVLSYTYDAVGNLTSANDNDAELAFSYDDADRIISASTGGTVQPVVTLNYSYDALSRRVLLVDSEGGSYSYAYDDADRMTSIVAPGNNAISLSYDPSGKPITVALPNGITEDFSYDPGGRTSSINHTSSSDTIASFAYSYDTLGNISKIVDHNGTRDFAYDALMQLTEVKVDSVTAESYSYDAVGNRTQSHLSSTHSFDLADRLTSDDSHTYVYDENGNLISKTNISTNEVTMYTYDSQDQMVGIALPSGVSVSLAYDALGRRISRTVDGETSAFINDGPNLFLEFGEEQSQPRRYVYGNQVDRLYAVVESGNSFYFHNDHLGTPYVITSASATITNSYEYEAFGRYKTSAGSISNRIAFTGREYDSVSDLLYLRARYLDMNTGRFTQVDRLDLDGGDINLYRYVQNSPLLYDDPSGNCPWCAPAIIFLYFVLDPDPANAPGPSDPTFEPKSDLQRAGEAVLLACPIPAVRFARGAKEPTFFGKNLRIAPFGNRTWNKYGKWPHYHRRGPKGADGKTVPGQGIGRHRPWEKKTGDKSFWDRF